MVLSNAQAIKIIKKNKIVSTELTALRDDSEMLYALVNGNDFNQKLIQQIEFIEGTEKAKARSKYSRNMQDFFKRLFQPLDNIWYATGGNKVYNIDDDEVKMTFLKQISNIKDSNTLSHWIQNTGVELSHVDPNGLMFLEYTTKGRKEVFPTYKNIKQIRKYQHRGQLVEWVLFEPVKKNVRNGQNLTLWRIVDDKQDRTFIEDGNNNFTLSAPLSFPHPFGEVPAIINSNIVKVDNIEVRLSPINIIFGLAKEYARDQSIKTIYKFLQGFPIHWRYVTECEECKGLPKKNNKSCTSCNGRGYKQKGDVTDMVTLPIPNQDSPVIAPNIAGHITPDLEVWDQYNTELDILERVAIITFWGTPLNSIETFGTRKTTTEVLFNKQPIENTLNRYADYIEFTEWKMSEWILNFWDNGKNKNEQNIKITYGRNYVIEPSDTILKRYEEARKAQENDVILDEIFKQYLQATYRTNPVELALNVLKSEVEPYIHQTLDDVTTTFGLIEGQRKVLFGKWWNTLKKDDFGKKREALIQEYETWFDKNKVEIQIETKKE